MSTKRYTADSPLQARATGLDRWNELDGARSGFMRRLEGYASVTIPKVLLPDGQDQNSTSIQFDWTSVGAQAVNHLTNKIILALFRPANPFFRLDLDKKLMTAMIAESGGKVNEDIIREVLVKGEQDALRVLDRRALRPRLNEAVRNLIITGNVLIDLLGDDMLVTGIRDYAVKRTAQGKVVEILQYQRVLRDELEDDVQRSIPLRGKLAEEYVDYVKQYRLRNKRWTLHQFVNNTKLDQSYDAEWPENNFALYPLTWDLATGHDYGTGLVEDYAGDFGTLSTLSEAEIKLALLVSDYRWLADPSGVTDVAEFRRTRTGDVIQGRQNDVQLVNATSTGPSLQYVSAAADKVIRRIGQGFLLGSAVTRNAERVTAEEIRLQAQELETSLGGVYSRLAIDMQLPMAKWLLKQVDLDLKGTKIETTIVTGLDALSRNAEAQQLAQFLGDLAAIQNLGEGVLMAIKLGPIVGTMAAARGLQASKYTKTQEEISAEVRAQQQANTNQVATEALAKEGAKAVTQEPTE